MQSVGSWHTVLTAVLLLGNKTVYQIQEAFVVVKVKPNSAALDAACIPIKQNSCMYVHIGDLIWHEEVLLFKTQNMYLNWIRCGNIDTTETTATIPRLEQSWTKGAFGQTHGGGGGWEGGIFSPHCMQTLRGSNGGSTEPATYSKKLHQRVKGHWQPRTS